MMRFVELSLWATLIIMLLAYLNYYYPQYSKFTMFGLFRESMTEMDKPPKVTLFGDSILNNSRYVPLGKSVGASLRDIYGSGLRINAQDGASINNVYNQVEQYETYNKISDNTHIVISAGGNNMLNAMNVHALNNESVDKFASQYRRLVKHVCTTFPEAHIYLLNVYHPAEERYDKISKYIDRWNDSVASLVGDDDLGRLSLIDVAGICTEEEDFVSEIEPSSKGGKKIAREIVNKINEFL
jgi:hypothetical protein